MTRPYASVILPTLNRSSTLPYALDSVRAQSETALEILIVLDGATDACRDIAVAIARIDERVVALDLPKAAGDGRENIDAAVARAAADKIFYIDDDDLWLPDHVAGLGPLLEQADVADSRVCSLDRCGHLHLAPCRGSNPRMRELLGHETRLKLLYDTHIAHRKDAYGRLSSWLARGATGTAVWDFLSGFANNPQCKWTSHDDVTAISIHGAARNDLTPEDRADEIARWAARVGDLRGALNEADSLFHLFRLLLIDPPRDGELAEYLASRGGYGEKPPSSLERSLFAMFVGTPPPRDVAVNLAAALAEPVESGYMFESIALMCFEAYGQQDHESILLEVASQSGANPAARLAAYSAAVSRRDLPLAIDVARHAVALGPDPIGSLARWCEKLEQRSAAG